MAEKKRSRSDLENKEDKEEIKETKREEKKSRESQTVSILKLDLKKEFVTILNYTAHDVDVSEWKLLSVKGHQTFSFPKGTVMQSGSSINVWSGKDSHKRNFPANGSFAWTEKFVWNDKGDVAQLLNKEGKVVDEKEDHPPAHDGTITIEHLDLQGEVVTIINSGPHDQDISGWVVRSLVGPQTFIFKNDTVLKAGATCVLWSGKESDAKDHPPHSFFWTKKSIWNNHGDTAALFTKEGKLVCSKHEFPDTVPHQIDIEKLHKH